MKNLKIMISLILASVLMLGSVFAVSAGNVTVDFDIDSGSITIENFGIDSSTWHTGSLGQSNFFTASGDVVGSYAGNEGNYGSLSTTINAYTGVGGGIFILNEYMDFNILSANHNYNTEGYVTAIAEGDYAEMNIRTSGSMYQWNEADVPSWSNLLVGQHIYQTGIVTQNDVRQGELTIEVITTGSANLDSSNQYSLGIYESGMITTQYSGAVTSVEATGDGLYFQQAIGADYTELNGITLLGGGTITTTGSFTGGLLGTYTMAGN